MKTWIKLIVTTCFFNSLIASPSFYDESQRILNLYCVQCHNDQNIKLTQGLGFGGFSLQNLSALPKKRDDKILIKPGDAEKSLLYRVLVVEVNNNQNIKAMPLAGQRLNSKEIDVIKSWINAGAESPVDTKPEFVKLSFEDEIAPILKKNCISCHNPESKSANGGNLDLTNMAGLMQGGHSGPVVVAGKPYKSMLYLATAMRDEERFAMPPADRYARLSLLQISKIRQWITEGAEWPEGLELSAVPEKKIEENPNDSDEMKLVRKIHAKILEHSQGDSLETYIEDLPTGVNFTMKPIPAGRYQWQGKEAKEGSMEVKLSAFWMGKTEVTWEEYEPFMLSELPRERDGQLLDFMKEQVDDLVEFVARPTAPYHTMSFGMPKEGHPALSMTQHAANKYCQWISYQTGHFYRLPTEAEWEYAFGANQGETYWGNQQDKASQFSVFGGGQEAHYGPVGALKPNKHGLHDMAGNVAEWTLDKYVENRKKFYGSLTQLIDPWIKATSAYPHVVKGGHYRAPYKDILMHSRVPSDPQWKASDPQVPKSVWYLTDYPFIGFRVVRPLKIPTAEEMYAYWNSGVEYDD